MEENKDYDVQTHGKMGENKCKAFFGDVLAGVMIGVAFIIPGFSGGSVAAILGIYERLIEAIAGLFKNLKDSLKTLLPIGLGMVLGALALLFPLSFALSRWPLPTVALFVGLAIGGVPSITSKIPGKMTKTNYISLILPTIFALLLCFLPVGADVNLFGLTPGGYAVLFLVGVLGSSALVIPGISGSMILLILGYYNPIVRMITDHLLQWRDLGSCIAVLLCCALGIAVGFMLISVIMKILLKKYHRGTYFAIVGFIVGSLPAVFVSTMKDAGMLTANMQITELPTSPIYWIACVILLAAGAALSYGFVLYNRKKQIAEKAE